MARKVNKKERLARVVAETLVSHVLSERDEPYESMSDRSCNLLFGGFMGVVSIVRTPELDTAVRSALEYVCKGLGIADDVVETCYAEYTCW